jgi:hypothetical protein
MVYQTILQKLNNKQPNSIELASCGIYDVAGKLILSKMIWVIKQLLLFNSQLWRWLYCEVDYKDNKNFWQKNNHQKLISIA